MWQVLKQHRPLCALTCSGTRLSVPQFPQSHSHGICLVGREGRVGSVSFTAAPGAPLAVCSLLIFAIMLLLRITAMAPPPSAQLRGSTRSCTWATVSSSRAGSVHPRFPHPASAGHRRGKGASPQDSPGPRSGVWGGASPELSPASLCCPAPLDGLPCVSPVLGQGGRGGGSRSAATITVTRTLPCLRPGPLPSSSVPQFPYL